MYKQIIPSLFYYDQWMFVVVVSTNLGRLVQLINWKVPFTGHAFILKSVSKSYYGLENIDICNCVAGTNY